MYSRTAHPAQCLKSRALTKVIYLIIDIESFEQQYFILKDLLQSDWMKQHIITIGIDKLLSNCEMYEHRCLVSIKKLYTYDGKCNYQIQFKAIIEE